MFMVLSYASGWWVLSKNSSFHFPNDRSRRPVLTFGKRLLSQNLNEGFILLPADLRPIPEMVAYVRVRALTKLTEKLCRKPSSHKQVLSQSEEQTRSPVGANDVFDMPIVQSNVRAAWDSCQVSRLLWISQRPRFKVIQLLKLFLESSSRKEVKIINQRRSTVHNTETTEDAKRREKPDCFLSFFCRKIVNLI